MKTKAKRFFVGHTKEGGGCEHFHRTKTAARACMEKTKRMKVNAGLDPKGFRIYQYEE